MFPFFCRSKALLFLCLALAALFFLGHLGDTRNAAFFLEQSRKASKLQMDTLIDTVIKHELSHFHVFLNSLASDPELLPFFQGEEMLTERVRFYFRHFLRLHPSVHYVFYASHDGTLLFEPRGELPEGYDARRRPWFRHALQDPGRTLWTPPYTEMPTGKEVVSLVLAMQDPVSGTLWGVLGMEVLTQTFQDLISDIALPEGGFMAILAPNGHTIAASHPEKIVQLMQNPKTLVAMLSEERHLLPPETGAPALGISSRLLENPQWRILQGIPDTNWHIPGAPGRNAALLLMAALLLAFFFLHFRCYRQIQRESQDLESHVLDVCQKGSAPLPKSSELPPPLITLCIRMARERYHIEEARRSLEQELHTLILKAPTGIFTSSPEGRFLDVNPVMTQILEYDSPQDLIQHMDDIARDFYLDRQDRKILKNHLLEGGISDFPVRFRKKNGSIGHGSICAYPEKASDGTLLSIRGFFTDRTRLHQLENQLRHMAHTDRLTGLPNRRSFMDLLQRETNRFCRYGSTFTLLVLNVDDFRGINARYGHAAADKILSDLAGLLTHILRNCDTLARIDGDTFAVHLAETPFEEGCTAALRMKKRIHAMENLTIPGLRLTVSMGVSAPRDSLRCPDLLLQETEARMYTVKKRGGNGIHPPSVPS